MKTKITEADINASSDTKADYKAIFCYSKDLRRALQSGLMGTLQKYGNTNENKDTVEAALWVTLKQHFGAELEEGEDRAILESELSKTVFLGVSYILALLATTPDGKPDDKATQICQDVINDLAEMGVETAKNTLSVRFRQEAAEKEAADKAKKEAAARAAAIAEAARASYYAELHQTGPFSGSGAAVDGLWTFGSLAYPGSS